MSHRGQAKQHLFLSPHPDDVVLSLGGTLAALLTEGVSCQTLTICAAPPELEPPMSEVLSQYLKEDLGKQHVDESDATTWHQIRLDEDRAAFQELGATVCYFDVQDGVFRGRPTYYPTEQELFGPPHLEELSLPGRWFNTMRTHAGRPDETRLYLPLGVGGHVDHRLTFEMGRLAMQAGYECCFYAEFPYSLEERAVQQRVSQCGLPLRRIARDITLHLEQKQRAILCYQSQLQGLFAGADQMPFHLHRYHKVQGAERFEESLWVLKELQEEGEHEQRE